MFIFTSINYKAQSELTRIFKTFWIFWTTCRVIVLWKQKQWVAYIAIHNSQYRLFIFNMERNTYINSKNIKSLHQFRPKKHRSKKHSIKCHITSLVNSYSYLLIFLFPCSATIRFEFSLTVSLVTLIITAKLNCQSVATLSVPASHSWLSTY